MGDQEVVLGHRHREARHVRLLEGVVADHGGGHLSRDRDDRDRVHLRVRQGGHEVASPRARGGDAHPDLARGPGVSLGRVPRPLLVAAQHVADPGIDQRVVGGQDRSAGDPEDGVDALQLEGLEHRLRSGQLHPCNLLHLRSSSPGDGGVPLPAGSGRVPRSSGAAVTVDPPRSPVVCDDGSG